MSSAPVVPICFMNTTICYQHSSSSASKVQVASKLQTTHLQRYKEETLLSSLNYLLVLPKNFWNFPLTCWQLRVYNRSGLSVQLSVLSWLNVLTISRFIPISRFGLPGPYKWSRATMQSDTSTPRHFHLWEYSQRKYCIVL